MPHHKHNNKETILKIKADAAADVEVKVDVDVDIDVDVDADDHIKFCFPKKTLRSISNLNTEFNCIIIIIILVIMFVGINRVCVIYPLFVELYHGTQDIAKERKKMQLRCTRQTIKRRAN